MWTVFTLKLMAVFLRALKQLCYPVGLGEAVRPGFSQVILVSCASWRTMDPVCRDPKAGTVSLGRKRPGKQAQDLKKGGAGV